MPFIAHFRPSIQLGLLKAIASSHGFPVETFHLNLDFARQVGPEPYEGICNYGRNLGLGEWLFSVAAFGEEAPDHGRRLLEHCLEQYPTYTNRLLAALNQSEEYLFALRDRGVPEYLDRMMETVPWDRFEVVGFTATFQQNAASFALAARIKREFPSVKVLFGGANFEGEMGVELVRSIPCIDYAVIGEGDTAFPEFLIALQEGRDPAEVAGVACRRNGVVSEPRNRPLFRQLDNLPFPDYDEYFERAERLGLVPAWQRRRKVEVPFESARGCWWGQKHHCTFCGLNGKGIAFRGKSPERVLEELGQAAKRYRTSRFSAVDNILDMSYLKTFLPRLVEEGAGYDLFYELKANLTREQIALLKDAGVRCVQPGIESLNSHVLDLMGKGTTGIRNVNTLRWARYYGIDVVWNILYGFPGERAEDYRQQEEIIRRIPHLEPPNAFGRILLERFSPMFSDRASYPVRYMRPQASYGYVYPEHVDLEQVAYTFDYEFEEGLPASEFRETERLVEAWKAAWRAGRKPSLTYQFAEGGVLQIEDLRDPSEPVAFEVSEPLASVYAALSDRPNTATRVKEGLNLPLPTDELEAALDEFCAQGLMMREGRSFLSLALPAKRKRRAS
jgi:ribosomal peptide maturation radical SAM protein 1